MANAFSWTYAVGAGFANSTGLQEALGASPHIHIYGGTIPANADAALGGATQLAELVCAATPITSVTQVGQVARATFAAIADDTSADNTGTAAFFRITDAAGTTVKAQGTCGTGSGFDMLLNTTAIQAAADVSITSATIDFPLGP